MVIEGLTQPMPFLVGQRVFLSLLRIVSHSSTRSYHDWTKEELLARLMTLDRNTASAQSSLRHAAQTTKSLDFCTYPVRKIALKFCYSGWEYNGLAFQEGPTPLPTVEGVLFNAMAQTWLVDPEGGLEACGWERCGRTDRGVSAAGQVISVWVRTALEPKKDRENGNGVEEYHDGAPGVSQLEDSTNLEPTDSDTSGLVGDFAFTDDLLDDSSSKGQPSRPAELRYVSIINRVLPPTIRVLAWSPVAPTFSARFACKHRHYKYFFSSHGLDITLMRDGACRLVGAHDFRNLCKLDASKQITNFKRRILRAEINPVSNAGAVANDTLYVLDLVGTAFLYHQVRHIMAVLFLIGAGLEHPSVVSSLLNVGAEHLDLPQPSDSTSQMVDRKPEYQMADGLPLVLWDCGYADSDVQWRTDSVDGEVRDPAQRGTATDIYRQLHSIHARSVIRTALDAHFLAAAAKHYVDPPLPFIPLFAQTGCTPATMGDDHAAVNIPLGGGTFRRTTKYVPLLMRNRLDSVEVTNERWRLGKGLRKDERRKAEAASTSKDNDDGDDE